MRLPLRPVDRFSVRGRVRRRERAAGAADHPAGRPGGAPSDHLHHHRADRRRAERAARRGRRSAGARRRIQRRDRRRPDRSDRGAAGQCRESPSTATCCAQRRARSGTTWCQAAIEAGLGGLECLSGIPGSAGATPVQNVGAYGAEVADTITRVRLLDRRTGEVRWVPAVRARLRLPHQRAQASAVRIAGADRAGSGVRARRVGSQRAAAVRRTDDRAGRRRASVPTRRGSATPCWRCARRKGMVLDAADHDTWSVGSFFTNPVVTPERFERAAGRGRRSGAALSGRGRREAGRRLAGGARRLRQGLIPDDGAACRLSTKHALALTNRGERHQRGRRRLGPHRPRRGARRVRHHAGSPNRCWSAA